MDSEDKRVFRLMYGTLVGVNGTVMGVEDEITLAAY